MFLSKNYILSNEIVQKAGIHIANISMSIKTLEDSDTKSGLAVKLGNCTFLNKQAKNLPTYIKNYMDNPEWSFEDFSDKLPVTYVASEFGVPANKIEEAFKKSNYLESVETIAGKKFFKFTKEFRDLMEDKTWYILSKEEAEDCLKNGEIDGFTPLYKEKYFTWY